MKKMKFVILTLFTPLLLASCGGDARAQVLAKAETYSVTNASAKYNETGSVKTVSTFAIVKGEEADVKAFATSLLVPTENFDDESIALITPLELATKDAIEAFEEDVKNATKKSETEYVTPSYTYSDAKVTAQATYSNTDTDLKYSSATDLYREWNDVGLYTSYVDTVAYVNEDQSLQFIHTLSYTYTWIAK